MEDTIYQIQVWSGSSGWVIAKNCSTEDAAIQLAEHSASHGRLTRVVKIHRSVVWQSVSPDTKGE